MHWLSRLKVRFAAHSKTVNVEFGDSLIEHGDEFYGDAIHFLDTPATECALLNICPAMSRAELAYLCHGPGMRKKHLLSSVSCFDDRFLFTLPAFAGQPPSVIARMLLICAANSCWLLFHSRQHFSEEDPCFIYEGVREFIRKRSSAQSTVATCETNASPHPSSMIFFTGMRDIYRSTTFRHQLRSNLKPVGCGQPNRRMIIKIKMSALGFKTTKDFPHKFSLLLSILPSEFPYMCAESSPCPGQSILSDSHDLLWFLMHGKGVPFVNYHEPTRTAEEFVVAKACYHFLFPQIEHHQLPVFLQLPASHFQICDTLEEFQRQVVD
jgi:hypothetical protein